MLQTGRTPHLTFARHAYGAVALFAAAQSESKGCLYGWVSKTSFTSILTGRDFSVNRIAL
jgi:hypothetical protein